MRRLGTAIRGLDLPAVEKIAGAQSGQPFQILIATLLSARTQDAATHAASTRLFRRARTPRTMAGLTVAEIEQLIYPVSFYRNKARHVKACCEMLVSRFGGRVPASMDDLVMLPGVGRKTANVVLNTVYGEPTMAVDTHVFRVANRTGLAPGANPLEVEEKLLKVIPKKYMLNAHHWLILHGRYTCVARTPLCGQCVVRDLCAYPDKTDDVIAELKKPRKR